MSKIQENIKNTSMELIERKLRDTMLNIVFDMCDMHLSKPDLGIPAQANELLEEIKQYVLKLPEALEKDLSQRDEYINALKALGKKYANAVLPLYLYINALNQAGGYGVWLYKCATAEKLPSEGYLPIEYSIRDYIDEYISSSEDLPEKHYRMSEVLSSVPLRMPRQRYFDLVREGLAKTLEGAKIAQVKGTVKMVKTGAYPRQSKLYGAFMPEIKEKTDVLCDKSLDKMTAEELEGFLDEVDEIQQQLQELADYLNIGYNDINYLTALASFAIDEEYLITDNMLLKDAVYSCRDMLKTRDYDLYAEALLEKAADLIEDNFEPMRELDNKFMEYISEYLDTKFMNEELSTLVKTYININQLYIRELEDGLQIPEAPEDYDIASDEYIKKSLDELMEYFSSMPDSISAGRNKFIRRYFLSTLPVVMTDGEFNDYLDYALEAVRSKGAGIAALTDLYNMLTEEGVISEDEDEAEDCSCAHGHSHLHIVKDKD